MQRIKPKRSLGQNFLNDKNIAKKMVHLFAPSDSDSIVEIGPGTGVLTGYLAERCGRLYLVEKDDRAVGLLKNTYKDSTHIEVLQGDVLDFSFSEIAGATDNLRIIGNIPYNITSPILFRLIDERDSISDVMLLVQREVADRINSPAASPEYGILSVLMQTWATTNYLFTVPPSVFYPRPSVTSAVIHIKFDRKRPDIADDGFYKYIVRGTFGKRRKMLRASLKTLFPDLQLDPVTFPVDLNKRPEECTVNDFIKLTGELYNVST